MKRCFALFVVCAFAAALPLRAEEPREGDKKESKAPRKLRLTKPWADLTTLTEEQKVRISEIHAEYVEKRKALEEEEEAAIMALLSDESKAELEQYEAAKKQAQKERNAARRAAEKGESPSTQPSGR